MDQKGVLRPHFKVFTLTLDFLEFMMKNKKLSVIMVSFEYYTIFYWKIYELKRVISSKNLGACTKTYIKTYARFSCVDNEE